MTTPEDVTDRPVEAAPAPQQWWQAKGLPWQHKPSREEVACLVAYAMIGVYSFVMMPLKPTLLAADPIWLALADGGRVAMVAIGGLTGTEGYSLWWLGLLLATLSYIKFDAIYWWAGKLWGDAFLQMATVDKSDKTLARQQRVKDFTQKNLFWAVLLSHLPIPFPDLVVGIAAGASGVSLKRYLAYDFFLALPFRAAYMYAGFVFKDEATAMVKVVERYSLYLSLGIVAGMLVTWYLSDRKKKAAAA